jgi:threonine dehydrogenase-like Zn-dependent dehydrogenase
MHGMYYGMGEEAASGGWGSFFKTLAQNSITSLVGQIPALKPPASAAAPAAAPAPAGSSSLIATTASAAKSTWPIIAVGGAGVLGLVAVLMLKKKRS